jgi:hypothetical protein
VELERHDSFENMELKLSTLTERKERQVGYVMKISKGDSRVRTVGISLGRKEF